MDCRSESEGKTDEGSGYDERNVKDNPSSVAARQLPPEGKPQKIRLKKTLCFNVISTEANGGDVSEAEKSPADVTR